ncbi:MAG: NfeD family protein [Clostridia bacterium]|nr:NfeD family protein [Clostridia bacterium]
MVYLWLGAFLVFLVVEAVTVGLVSIWFAGGSLVSLAAAAFNAPLWLQFLLFVVVSAVLLIFTKPLITKYVNNKTIPTNADALIGKTAIVIEDIDNDETVGQVKVGGQIWSAYTEEGNFAKKGDKVTVKSISGVHLIVK